MKISLICRDTNLEFIKLYCNYSSKSFNNLSDVKSSTNPKLDIVSSLRAKYGELLNRDHIETIDVSKLNREDKESLRKLKISIANKGKKPWNFGRHHRPDTLERIRERTRIAMHRSDVRERWKASWVPKSHTEETKEKLKRIMLKKEEAKMIEMTDWLFNILKLDSANYKTFSIKCQDTYRHLFNVIWRKQFAKTINRKKSIKTDLINAYLLNVSIHLLEADRQQIAKERRKSKLIKKIKPRKWKTNMNYLHLSKSLKKKNRKHKIIKDPLKQKTTLKSRDFLPKASVKSLNSKSGLNTSNKKTNKTFMKYNKNLLITVMRLSSDIINKTEYNKSISSPTSNQCVNSSISFEKNELMTVCRHKIFINCLCQGINEKIALQTWNLGLIVRDLKNYNNQV